MMRPLLLSAFAAWACLVVGAAAQDAPRLTGPTPFTKEAAAPPMQRQVTDDIRRKRNYPAAHYNRGLALLKSGDSAAARAEFEIAHRLDPQIP